MLFVRRNKIKKRDIFLIIIAIVYLFLRQSKVSNLLFSNLYFLNKSEVHRWFKKTLSLVLNRQDAWSCDIKPITPLKKGKTSL